MIWVQITDIADRLPSLGFANYREKVRVRVKERRREREIRAREPDS